MPFRILDKRSRIAVCRMGRGRLVSGLRYTISTRMREIGIRPDVVERIIGHNVDSGIVEVYCMMQLNA